MSKAKKGGKDDGNADLGDQILILEGQIKKYQHLIVDQQERADRAKVQENQMKEKIVTLDKEFKQEKEKLFSISNDMNRQYNQMQEELLKDINERTKQIEEKDDIVKQLDLQYQTKEEEYRQRLRRKDEEVVELKKKIEDMSAQFARMLRETLDKMQERIELAQWDNEGDATIAKKLKDVA